MSEQDILINLFGSTEAELIQLEAEEHKLSLKDYFRKCVLSHTHKYSFSEVDLYEGKY